jgi:hypothetical protein
MSMLAELIRRVRQPNAPSQSAPSQIAPSQSARAAAGAILAPAPRLRASLELLPEFVLDHVLDFDQNQEQDQEDALGQPTRAPCGCARCDFASKVAKDAPGASDFACELCERCAAAGWLPCADAACLAQAAPAARHLVWVDLRNLGAAFAARALLAAVVNEAAHVRGLLLDGWPVTDADLQLGAPARLEVLGVAGCAALTPRALADFTNLRALDIRGCFAAALKSAVSAAAESAADSAAAESAAESAASVALALAAAPLQVVSVARGDSFRALCGFAPPLAQLPKAVAARARSPGPLERAAAIADRRLARLGIISSSYLGSTMLAALAPRLRCLVE